MAARRRAFEELGKKAKRAGILVPMTELLETLFAIVQTLPAGRDRDAAFEQAQADCSAACAELRAAQGAE